MDIDYVVIEVGMNYFGEILLFVKMVCLYVVIVMIVVVVYFEVFDDINGIVKEKVSICDGFEFNGVVVLNGDLFIM